MRKSTRPAGGTSKPYLHIPDTSSNRNLLPGTILGGKTTLLMMIPGGNPMEVLDLPVHPYDTGPRAPE